MYQPIIRSGEKKENRRLETQALLTTRHWTAPCPAWQGNVAEVGLPACLPDFPLPPVSGRFYGAVASGTGKGRRLVGRPRQSVRGRLPTHLDPLGRISGRAVGLRGGSLRNAAELAGPPPKVSQRRSMARPNGDARWDGDGENSRWICWQRVSACHEGC